MSIKYEEIEIENPMDQSVQKHIIVDLGESAFESFPVDENNPRYVAFLGQLEAEATA